MLYNIIILVLFGAKWSKACDIGFKVVSPNLGCHSQINFRGWRQGSRDEGGCFGAMIPWPSIEFLRVIRMCPGHYILFGKVLVGGLEHEFYFSIYWECHHPNWRTHIFQGCFTINQSRKISPHGALNRISMIWDGQVGVASTAGRWTWTSGSPRGWAPGRKGQPSTATFGTGMII